jgi:hypothetical protein
MSRAGWVTMHNAEHQSLCSFRPALQKNVEVARFCAVTLGASSVMTLGLVNGGLIEVAASLWARVSKERNYGRAASHAVDALLRCSFQECSCI